VILILARFAALAATDELFFANLTVSGHVTMINGAASLDSEMCQSTGNFKLGPSSSGCAKICPGKLETHGRRPIFTMALRLAINGARARQPATGLSLAGPGPGVTRMIMGRETDREIISGRPGVTIRNSKSMGPRTRSRWTPAQTA
jgi:hypothetical protein